MMMMMFFFFFFFARPTLSVTGNSGVATAQSGPTPSQNPSIELGVSLPETMGSDATARPLSTGFWDGAPCRVTAGTGAIGSITGARLPQVTASAGVKCSLTGTGAVSVTAGTGAIGSITGARLT